MYLKYKSRITWQLDLDLDSYSHFEQIVHFSSNEYVTHNLKTVPRSFVSLSNKEHFQALPEGPKA